MGYRMIIEKTFDLGFPALQKMFHHYDGTYLYFSTGPIDPPPWQQVMIAANPTSLDVVAQRTWSYSLYYPSGIRGKFDTGLFSIMGTPPMNLNRFVGSGGSFTLPSGIALGTPAIRLAQSSPALLHLNLGYATLSAYEYVVPFGFMLRATRAETCFGIWDGNGFVYAYDFNTSFLKVFTVAAGNYVLLAERMIPLLEEGCSNGNTFFCSTTDGFVHRYVFNGSSLVETASRQHATSVIQSSVSTNGNKVFVGTWHGPLIQPTISFFDEATLEHIYEMEAPYYNTFSFVGCRDVIIYNADVNKMDLVKLEYDPEMRSSPQEGAAPLSVHFSLS